jgi:uncharacterized protein (DUF362 family)
MNTIAKHTGYFLINEKGNLEMVTYSPDQDYSGRKDSDQYSLAQGLFIDDISHDLWLSNVKCHRVVGTTMGLQTIKNLNCKIIAKQTFNWDMSKPVGSRQSDLKKSNKWDECFSVYRKSK